MTFQIGLAQFKPLRKNIAANIHHIQDLLGGIKADLIVLPELSNSGYLYDNPSALLPFAEDKDGSGVFLSAIKTLAKETGATIITGYAERGNNQLFNSASAVTPDGALANYQKTHLYDEEKQLFSKGDTGFKVFEWRDVKIGMMICFDWIFPESARTLALSGAQIIAHPANLVMPYCQDAMVTRAIENKVFTVTANRIGKERLGLKELNFTGVSQITDPAGNVLYRAPENKATVHVATIDPEMALDKTISNRNNLFDDRRPNLYIEK
jgi:predicted amidohydrolase